MQTQNFSFEVSPEIGKVSASIMDPGKPKCIMILAHGAGAGMSHNFMVALAEALAEHNIATLRFNFPFIENKKSRPDLPPVAHKTIERAVQQAREKYPSLPLFLSGKSFGGRMSSQWLAKHAEEIKGIVFYGFPLHPMNKPSIDRADHLKNIKQPMLFLQGTRDTLAEWSRIVEVSSSLKNATLVKIEGADHSFKKGKQNLIPELATHTKDWIDKTLK